MGAKVLVVDDESVTRRVVIFALKSIDIEVLGAENGQEALALAGEHEFDLAIIDINLPDMDGFEVIRHLKTLPRAAHTPTIIFTARNHPGDENQALDVGAVGFLYKPFSTQELRDLVLSHLKSE